MRRVQQLLLASLLLAMTVPGPSLAGPGASAIAPDAFESPGDDTWAEARAITLPGHGEAPLEQNRTFDVAGIGEADEDWVSFDVNAAQADAGYVFLVEAIPTTRGVPPVVEVYSPSDTPAEATTLAGIADPAASACATSAPWTATGGASAVLAPAAGVSATYRVRVRPLYEGAAAGFSGAATSYVLRAKAGLVTRLSGSDRAASAARVSRERYPAGPGSTGRAVVAAGDSFADALAGSTLAGVIDCPLLLTAPQSLSPAASRELVRLGVRRVYLLGGPAAVSDTARRDIERLGITVRRISGRTRYDTAAAVARCADALAGPSGTSALAFVVSGESFADATCASAPAAWAAVPVLLARPDGLPAATAAALRDPALGIRDVVIVGGTAAVPRRVEDAVTAIVGHGHVLRVAGRDRYETSSRLARWATADRAGSGSVGTSLSPAAIPALNAERVGVASGAAFSDALTGGVFCGLSGAPMLLTEPGCVSPYVFAGFDPLDDVGPGDDYVGDRGIGRSWVFGGWRALSGQVTAGLDLLSAR